MDLADCSNTPSPKREQSKSTQAYYSTGLPVSLLELLQREPMPFVFYCRTSPKGVHATEGLNMVVEIERVGTPTSRPPTFPAYSQPPGFSPPSLPCRPSRVSANPPPSLFLSPPTFPCFFMPTPRFDLPSLPHTPMPTPPPPTFRKCFLLSQRAGPHTPPPTCPKGFLRAAGWRAPP